MKVRKLFLAGLTAGLALTTLASCFGSKRSANYVVPEEGLDTNTEMTIVFYHTMGASLQEVLQTAVDQFEKDYPNIKIDHKQIGGYDDVRNQITTEIPNGNEPHIAYCYPDHVALYNRSNAVVQLDTLIEHETYGFNDNQLADFIEGYYNEGKQFGDGFMYTLPFSKSTEVLYYNKTEFEKNGWKVPTTWEETMALCKTIKEKAGFENCIPLGIDSEANLFITLCEQTGAPYTSATGKHFLFDNDQTRDFVTQFKDWFQKGYYTTQTILSTYTSSLFTATDKTKSYSLMSIGSTGGASHQYPASGAFEVGVAPVPVWGDNELKVISQGPSLCFFNKDNAQEVLASWIFVKNYLMTTQFQAAFSDASGYNPVLKSVYELEDYAANLNSAKGTSKEGLIALTAKTASTLVDNYYTSPAFNGSSKARDQVGNLFVAAISGTKTIAQAFEDAILECED